MGAEEAGSAGTLVDVVAFCVLRCVWLRNPSGSFDNTLYTSWMLFVQHMYLYFIYIGTQVDNSVNR